jgi:hypothetical protein
MMKTEIRIELDRQSPVLTAHVPIDLLLVWRFIRLD